MTEEEYKAKLKEQERALFAFENEHKEIFDEWLSLKSDVSNTKMCISNCEWMIGNYYRMYGDAHGDFYIHVERTLISGRELYGKVVRLIKPEYSDKYFSSAVIINGGLRLSYSGRVELVKITEEEFNKVAEGLPVYYDGRQEERYEE